MKEKELRAPSGMLMMFVWIVLYLASFVFIVAGGTQMEGGSDIGGLLFGIGLVWLCVGWIPLLGLRVLKPQEALVLTLFGKYLGTLKGAGFYWVNPFCISVNPAARTALRQSGDVEQKAESVLTVGAQANRQPQTDRRISLKMLTLNNNKQKINDCLGNPVEIGIAVTWRVVDTAKARSEERRVGKECRSRWSPYP
jgi:regulator of protease activity HflC (stomatin/prohibitin superfamily)